MWPSYWPNGGPVLDTKNPKCGPIIDPRSYIYIYMPPCPFAAANFNLFWQKLNLVWTKTRSTNMYRQHQNFCNTKKIPRGINFVKITQKKKSSPPPKETKNITHGSYKKNRWPQRIPVKNTKKKPGGELICTNFGVNGNPEPLKGQICTVRIGLEATCLLWHCPFTPKKGHCKNWEPPKRATILDLHCKNWVRSYMSALTVPVTPQNHDSRSALQNWGTGHDSRYSLQELS